MPSPYRVRVRSIRGMAAATVAGLLVGAAASVADNVPILTGEVAEARADRSGGAQVAEFVSLILDSGWAWAGLAVLAGWLLGPGRRPLAGALAGCLSLVVATAAFYGVDYLCTAGGDWVGVQFWWARALVLGPVLGAVGTLIRRPGLTGLIAALVVPVGAILNLIVLPLPGESRMATPVLVTVVVAATLGAALAIARTVRRAPAAKPVAPAETVHRP